MPCPLPALCLLWPCVTAFCNFAYFECAFYRSKSSVSLLSPLFSFAATAWAALYVFSHAFFPRVLDSAFPSHLISDFFLRFAPRSPANLRLLLCSSPEQQLPVSNIASFCCCRLFHPNPEPVLFSTSSSSLERRIANTFSRKPSSSSPASLYSHFTASSHLRSLPPLFVITFVPGISTQRAERGTNLSFRHSPLHTASRTSAALSATDILFNIFRPSATRPKPCSRNDQASRGPCPLKQTARPIGRQIIKMRLPPARRSNCRIRSGEMIADRGRRVIGSERARKEAGG